MSISDSASNGKVEATPQEDILAVSCNEGTSEVSGHTFSKCKYAQNECKLKIHSEDGGVMLKNEYIPYDGKPHGVVVDFKNEFEGIIGEKSVNYNAITNPEGVIYVNVADGTTSINPPTEPGFYTAVITYYDVQIKSGKIVVDTSKTHSAISNFYEIRGPELTVNVGVVGKTFDGTNAAEVSDC